MSGANRTKTVVCILGGNGFIGKHLIRLLHKETNIRIKTLSRQPDDVDFPFNVQVVKGNLLDPSSLEGFLESGSVVINLAYLNNQPADYNLLAAQHLVSACKNTGIKRLIHASTAVVVGRATEDIITENTPCCPITEYERTKSEIESLLVRELDENQPAIILRPTAIYGKGGKNLIKQIDEQMHGNPFIKSIRFALYNKRRLNLVHIQNVVSAIFFFIQQEGRGVHGERYIVSDDEFEENNYADVARMINDVFGLPPFRYATFRLSRCILKLMLRIKGRSNTNPQRIYCSEKLKQIGFNKPICFKDGINDFLSEIATNGFSPSTLESK